MALMKKKYDGNKAADVREFSEEIARMMNSGPAGANQAKRAIGELSRDPNGRKLVAGALKHAHRLEQSFGGSFAGVKAHTGGAAADAAGSMGAKAHATGEKVAFSGSSSTSYASAAHELAHVVQQRSGKKR